MRGKQWNLTRKKIWKASNLESIQSKTIENYDLNSVNLYTIVKTILGVQDLIFVSAKKLNCNVC